MPDLLSFTVRPIHTRLSSLNPFYTLLMESAILCRSLLHIVEMGWDFEAVWKWSTRAEIPHGQ
jgi:hypothetical protein